MIEDFLDQLADITAEAPDGQQPAQDALGGADRSVPWLPVAAGVPCLWRNTSASLMAFGSARDDARRNVHAGTIYFGESLLSSVPGGLNSRHRVTITDATDPAAIGVYAVLGCINPNTMGHHFEVAVERIRTP